MKAFSPLSPLILLLALSAAQAQHTEKGPQQKVLDSVRFEQNIGAALPADIVFRDARDKPVELASLAAQRPLILLLAWFDCPHLCPTLLEQLAKATAALPFDAGDYRVALVGIDPRTTPADARVLMKQLCDRHGRMIDNWTLLTGTEENIKKLADRIGFHYRYDAQRRSYAHPAGLVVVAPGGTVSHYLLRIEPEQPHLRLALIDAGRGKLGSAVDRLLLRCYQFDPHSGRYNLAVIRLLQGAGALSVIALAVFLVRLRGREKS
ncbi:SCO family protein [Microbulbifer halophilus]|uniref:SCO family protein n=1 Tax=Microbulbifer halophilus TaxID=453963 RepID=A0ABW5EFE1_9GAMM|nr:SCO family protein [Microbulbifer halophilus]MCW8127715.1 SCO family protein [Microbulbifer halophilus]